MPPAASTPIVVSSSSAAASPHFQVSSSSSFSFLPRPSSFSSLVQLKVPPQKNRTSNLQKDLLQTKLSNRSHVYITKMMMDALSLSLSLAYLSLTHIDRLCERNVTQKTLEKQQLYHSRTTAAAAAATAKTLALLLGLIDLT